MWNLRYNFIKRILRHSFFPVNIVQVVYNTYFEKHLRPATPNMGWPTVLSSRLIYSLREFKFNFYLCEMLLDQA